MARRHVHIYKQNMPFRKTGNVEDNSVSLRDKATTEASIRGDNSLSVNINEKKMASPNALNITKTMQSDKNLEKKTGMKSISEPTKEYVSGQFREKPLVSVLLNQNKAYNVQDETDTEQSMVNKDLSTPLTAAMDTKPYIKYKYRQNLASYNTEGNNEERTLRSTYSACMKSSKELIQSSASADVAKDTHVPKENQTERNIGKFQTGGNSSQDNNKTVPVEDGKKLSIPVVTVPLIQSKPQNLQDRLSSTYPGFGSSSPRKSSAPSLTQHIDTADTESKPYIKYKYRRKPDLYNAGLDSEDKTFRSKYAAVNPDQDKEDTTKKADDFNNKKRSDDTFKNKEVVNKAVNQISEPVVSVPLIKGKTANLQERLTPNYPGTNPPSYSQDLTKPPTQRAEYTAETDSKPYIKYKFKRNPALYNVDIQNEDGTSRKADINSTHSENVESEKFRQNNEEEHLPSKNQSVKTPKGSSDSPQVKENTVLLEGEDTYTIRKIVDARTPHLTKGARDQTNQEEASSLEKTNKENSLGSNFTPDRNIKQSQNVVKPKGKDSELLDRSPKFDHRAKTRQKDTLLDKMHRDVTKPNRNIDSTSVPPLLTGRSTFLQKRLKDLEVRKNDSLDSEPRITNHKRSSASESVDDYVYSKPIKNRQPPLEIVRKLPTDGSTTVNDKNYTKEESARQDRASVRSGSSNFPLKSEVSSTDDETLKKSQNTIEHTERKVLPEEYMRRPFDTKSEKLRTNQKENKSVVSTVPIRTGPTNSDIDTSMHNTGNLSSFKPRKVDKFYGEHDKSREENFDGDKSTKRLPNQNHNANIDSGNGSPSSNMGDSYRKFINKQGNYEQNFGQQTFKRSRPDTEEYSDKSGEETRQHRYYTKNVSADRYSKRGQTDMAQDQSYEAIPDSEKSKPTRYIDSRTPSRERTLEKAKVKSEKTKAEMTQGKQAYTKSDINRYTRNKQVEMESENERFKTPSRNADQLETTNVIQNKLKNQSQAIERAEGDTTQSRLLIISHDRALSRCRFCICIANFVHQFPL